MRKYTVDKLVMKCEKKTTRAIRLFDKLNKRVPRVIASHTRANNGKKWLNDDKKQVTLGYLTKTQGIFNTKTLIVGKHKFSLVTLEKVAN